MYYSNTSKPVHSSIYFYQEPNLNMKTILLKFNCFNCWNFSPKLKRIDFIVIKYGYTLLYKTKFIDKIKILS